MKREEFNNKLKEAGITKKEFAEIVQLKYVTVNTWGSGESKVPHWVSSWLENAIDARKYREILADLNRS